jgi:diaminopimelate decarboxylase
MQPNPYYEYDLQVLDQTINELNRLEAPFGLTVRYAVKANPHPEIIKRIAAAGIDFDASSSFEAAALIKEGIAPERISLSSQQSAHNLQELVTAGVSYVATSINQLQSFLGLENRPSTVGVRINPGLGAGGNMRTSTGGVNASFGIWHDEINRLLELCRSYDAEIDRVHIHVGSGADPSVWDSVMLTSLEIVERIPTASILDIGGGFKVHRYGNEKEADMPRIFEKFSQRLNEFADAHQRKLKLEIEPGTYMVAHCGTLVASVDDIVTTGPDGFNFLRLNTGMNDILRPTMYGAQHRIEVINDATTTEQYVVVGHNCESGDILTPQPGDPESIAKRELKTAQIGDEVRIYDTGAYCASMRASGYNSYPDAPEVFINQN